MLNNVPLILDIKGNSLDDGPGIRSVVFFKGCPLSCIWCHNPESKSAGTEISYDAKTCIGCKSCMEICPNQSLSLNNPYFIDRKTCDLCFKCIDICPSGAIERVGIKKTADEIIQEVKKDKPFFDSSGGGVTFSGGEPTLFIKFLSSLLILFKSEKIHTLIETCGEFNFETFEKLIYPYVDMIYYDIKLMDTENHLKYCGTNGDRIRNNFLKLHEKYLNGGVPVLARTPLIPGITDTDKNLSAIVEFYKKNRVKKAQVLPYHPLWQEKNYKMGMNTNLSDYHNLSDWMGRRKLTACKKHFLKSGIDV